MKIPSPVLFLLAAGLLALAGTGCSKQAKIARHLAQADTHFAAGRYDEAEIEYKNVIQLDRQNALAAGRLGSIYLEQGRLLPAGLLLKKALALAPDDLDVQLKLGLIQFELRDFDAARAAAGQILDRSPGHADASLLLANAANTPKDIEAALQRLKQLPATERAPVQVALGTLEVRQNHLVAAEADFQRAVTLDPKSAEAHGALGAFYLTRNNVAQAGPELKLASDLAPARSQWRIRYARFLIKQGDSAAGRQLAARMTGETPDYLPAWMLQAQLATDDRKYDEALALVERVLARDAIYSDAMLLRAQLRLAKGDTAKAVAELEKIRQMIPNSAEVNYQLGLAHAASGETRKAIDSLQQALLLAPGHTEARLLLSALNLKTRDQGAAITDLRIVVREHPELMEPRFQLADVYRTQNNPADALALYDSIERDFPGNPRTPMSRGLVLLQQGQPAAARQAFNLSLERKPGFPPAVEHLVMMDLIEKKFPAARQRVEAQIAQQPQSAELQILLARVFGAQQEMDRAESALQQAITLQPDAPAAYFILADFYVTTHQQAKALENYRKILATNPKDTTALMMTGLLNEQLKNYDAALAAYEKLLASDPNSGVALNNLAVLYAERFNQLDKALEVAQKARELFPHEAHMADTLGWILVQKRQYGRAQGLLQESADKLSDSAEVQYHLGVAHYQLGNEEDARTALGTAVQLSQNFPGIDDARKRLAVLEPAATRQTLETVLSGSPGDPIALIRLAAIYERAGDLGRAIDTYQAAVKASPTNVVPMLGLARIYSLQKDPAKAIEQARAARKLAPDNPAAGLALGRLSYQTRDYQYAFNLLQESARRQPDDPAVLRDLAAAAYSIGQVTEAAGVLRQSLELDGLSSRGVEARGFLELISLADTPAQAVDAGGRIAEILKSDPANVPALMVAAAISEQKTDASAAMATYEKILQQFPDFTPAKKRLAILYAATASDNKKAFDLGMKARIDFPNDPELAKALGIILHRQGDFTRALAMLKESAAKRGDDAELAYYLGLTQYRLKDTASARQSLQRAVDLKLKPELAAEARKILAELK